MEQKRKGSGNIPHTSVASENSKFDGILSLLTNLQILLVLWPEDIFREELIESMQS